MNSTTRIAIVDDHDLFRTALVHVINGFDGCMVAFEAASGKDLISKIQHDIPDLILLDLNMPGMDGFETAAWLHEHQPQVPILVLTMLDSEVALVRLLRNGIKGFMRKDVELVELKHAIHSIMKSGCYYSTKTAGRIASLFRNNSTNNLMLQNLMLQQKEVDLLKLVCTDLTYKEIAQRMNITPRGVDAIRDELFMKLDVTSRVGLAMAAVKSGIVNVIN